MFSKLEPQFLPIIRPHLQKSYKSVERPCVYGWKLNLDTQTIIFNTKRGAGYFLSNLIFDKNADDLWTSQGSSPSRPPFILYLDKMPMLLTPPKAWMPSYMTTFQSSPVKIWIKFWRERQERDELERSSVGSGLDRDDVMHWISNGSIHSDQRLVSCQSDTHPIAQKPH